MPFHTFDPLTHSLGDIAAVADVGRIAESTGAGFLVSGLTQQCSLGDRLEIHASGGGVVGAEVLRLSARGLSVQPDGPVRGIALGDPVVLRRQAGFCPDISWLGRVIDPDGVPLDGRSLMKGPRDYPQSALPPPATTRRGLGLRLETGMRLFNTMLPLVRGQRLGLFAGSGIGKSTLIGQFAANVDTDVTVIALVGERGREVRDFVENKIGPEGMSRSVVVAATSDRSALEKRRAALSAMAVAEYFRDAGRQVLLVVDSITRFAEAHREVALSAGEGATMRGFPPSTSQMIMSLCERAGPGIGEAGDITALFSVLVAGSDMEEPVADIIRGVLDGHVVLDRTIAERGRFPAVDVARSVSRALPEAANAAENALIAEARQVLGAWESAELMIQAGLYATGSDPATDRAIRLHPRLEQFFAEDEAGRAADSFRALAGVLEQPADALD